MSTQKTSNIDWMFAEVCANICEYAYEDRATIENYLKEQNIKFKKMTFIEIENAQGYGITLPTYSM